MPRWEPNAVGRLQEAAIELFERQGVEGTTVAEIARHAGLTERSFFNHFTAKTEVLFGPRSVRHREAVVQAVRDGPDSWSALDVAVGGLQAAAQEMPEELRAAAARRRKIIDANPELQEREDAKRRALIAAVAAALRARGADPHTALLTARTAALVEQIAEEAWTHPDATRTFGELLSEALTALRAAICATST